MKFHTIITRQSLPPTTLWVAEHPVSALIGAHNMRHLVPPDESGEWRFRDIKLVNADAQAECLVVWERSYNEGE